jgi:iron complex transport system permease protein
VNLVQTRLLGLLAIALLCGAAVAVAGPIGFVGLVVPGGDICQEQHQRPHRRRQGQRQADIFRHQTAHHPQELATGAMTALVGAPLFIFIAARFFK